MGFKVLDSDVFALPGTEGRYIHLGTIQNGLREYLCFLDRQSQKCYIEDFTGGSLNFIEDDTLAFELTKFCEDRGLTDLKRVHEKLGRPR
jgi:hypothetical protein